MQCLITIVGLPFEQKPKSYIHVLKEPFTKGKGSLIPFIELAYNKTFQYKAFQCKDSQIQP